MSQDTSTFGISIPDIFRSGVRGYFANPLPLSLAAALTLGTLLAFRVPAQTAFNDGELALSLAYDMIGLILASIVALPWYYYALDQADGRDIDLRRPLKKPGRFGAQAVA
ncbi:MAG: hypothetical protein KJO07_16630, partial [Deltaproteobacteria bacterium]|nr:hypothetical protein [Deltaproteobacteria bacterium]